MRGVVIVCALIAAASCVSVSDEVWASWKAKYEKVYENSVEDAIRRGNWEKNAERVTLHNLEESIGMHRYTQEMNFLQDLTHEEYVARLSLPARLQKEVDAEHLHQDLPETPSTQNWVNKGVVTDVKNQEQCGSCWSFSATGGLEGQWAMSHTLVSLSEQQLVACDNYDSGCSGGWYYNAWQYLINYGGSISESDYPYTSGNGFVSSCKESGKSIAATLSSYKCTTKGSEDSLKSAVGNIGPVSVAIDASQASFGSYSSGVYSDPRCSSRYLDHAVLSVGYNSDSQGDYWIVKNSWGPSWGQAGYIWMARNDNNMCGIASGPPCYPVV